MVAQIEIETPKRGRAFKWTQDEINYLKAHFEKLNEEEIAQVLGRSLNAIHNKMLKMRLMPTNDCNAFRMEELTIGFGCSEQKIVGWIKKGWLTSNHRRHFTDEDIRRFARKHPIEIDRLDKSAIDMVWLIDVLSSKDGLGNISGNRGETEKEEKQEEK